MAITVRPETRSDLEPIRAVNKSAFGGSDEADLVDALREEGHVVSSWVAVIDDRVVGHILFSRLQLETLGSVMQLIGLAPMAVLPDFQRQGIGTRLVEAGLDDCRRQGHHIVVVLGHPEYYPRFGFSAVQARSLECPFGGGDVWMAKELTPGALAGVTGRVVYPPPFGAFE